MIIRPTAVLFVVCVFSTALLAAAHEVTREPIAKAEEDARQLSIMAVLPDDTAECVPAQSMASCYAAYNADGELIAYAVDTSVKGYGGDIRVMTGISADGEVIAVNVYDNSQETPGLGARTSEEEFTAQFKGRSAERGFAVTKDIAKYDGYETVDAVTGATISSRAVSEAVTRAAELVRGGVQVE